VTNCGRSTRSQFSASRSWFPHYRMFLNLAREGLIVEGDELLTEHAFWALGSRSWSCTSG